jgi:hypothetical protein
VNNLTVSLCGGSLISLRHLLSGENESSKTEKLKHLFQLRIVSTIKVEIQLKTLLSMSEGTTTT